MTLVAECAEMKVDAPATLRALAAYSNFLLGGYDLFILEAARAAGLAQIITDDGDFVTVPGFRVFTANPSILSAARTQGKLIRRS